MFPWRFTELFFSSPSKRITLNVDTPTSEESQTQNSKHVPPLPQELHGRILGFVEGRADLLSLCRVSRMYHHEVNRLLYSSVDLPHNNLVVKNWFQMVARKPDLASLVHTITFGFLYGSIPQSTVTWFKIIRKGLMALVHLKELNLRKSSAQFLPSLFVWFIHNPTFRLQKFRNDMFDLAPTLSFLQSQPDLIVWKQLNATACELPGEILPNLVEVIVEPWILPKLSSRLITKIATKIQHRNVAEERGFINMLESFGQKLTTLILEREVREASLPIAEFVALLAAKLPLLERLSLRNRGEINTESTTEHLAATLSAFKHLNTISLIPSRSATRHSIYFDVLLPANRMETASHLFRYSSSLKRVALLSVDGKLVWYVRSTNNSLPRHQAILLNAHDVERDVDVDGFSALES